MSEYMEQHAVARLIGSPPGYVGHDEGGQLTEAVRRSPYSVVLFDEIEKAHPRVLNVLLQVLDDGRLTDGKGRTVDFANTIIIMTSNIGAEHLLKEMETSTASAISKSTKDKVMDEVKQVMRPELLNRLDDIVMFTPLRTQELSKIVIHQLHDLGARLADKDILLDMSPQAAQSILKCAYNPIYGARPLRRYLEKYIVTQLSRMMVAGELPNNSLVRIEEDPSQPIRMGPDGNPIARLRFTVTGRSPRPLKEDDDEDPSARKRRNFSAAGPVNVKKVQAQKAGFAKDLKHPGTSSSSKMPIDQEEDYMDEDQ